MIPPEDLAAIDEAFATVRTFAAQVSAAPSDAPWFRDVVAALLAEAPRLYGLMKSGLAHSTGLVAWTARSLLELNIYAQYVLLSKDNAQRFAANRTAEGIETFDAFQTWLARNDPSLVPGEVEWRLQELAELRAREDEAPPRLYSLKYLSAEVGLADEYAGLGKVCGKLSQPGVFSVTASAEELALFRPALFRAGAGYGMEIYQAVKDHLAVFGAAPR